MLVINELSVRIAGRLLIEKASATIPSGARVGLVGRNGTGKTTLFHAICGEISPEHGAITINARMRVDRIAQEAPDGPESLIETVLAADRERTRLLAEAETAEDPMRIAEVQTRLVDIGAHAAPARAAAILAGLGFDVAAQQRACAEFSGGWRMRVALAARLFHEPDVRPIEIPAPAKMLSPPIIALDDVAVGYTPDRPVLSRVTLRIDQDDRIALIGANGNGKSTLAKLLAGRLAATDGRIVRAERLSVGYFAQHQLDELDARESPFAHLRELMPRAVA